MSLKNASCEEFTELLASKISVPGGGGASGLVASIGVALGDMVGEFTVGKKTYADVEDEIIELMAAAQSLRIQLLDCIDKDAVAFEPLSKVYGMPKDAEGRDELMEKCLKDAAAVPFEILQLGCNAIDVLRDFADKGSKLMISDAATGAVITLGAIKGAAVNVKVNTKLMKDRAYADALDLKVKALLDEYEVKANQIYSDVMARL